MDIADEVEKFEFRISQALKSKPWTTESTIDKELNHVAPRPGSDIRTEGLEVASLGETHYLAFNGFSSYRPHYLLMTSDGYRRQWEPLDIDDFRAIHTFMDTLGGDSLVFFNCRVEGGCSRLHKHVQAIPRESFSGNPWHNIDNNRDALPFTYFIKNIEGDLSPETLLQLYNEGLAFVRRTLQWETPEDGGAPPHNLLLDRTRIMVVPRRAAGVGEVGGNSGGMLGLIWTQSDEHVQKWLQTGPVNVMKAIGVPKDS